jgi:glycosyltransferase involved in cell wall biosynthesis
MLPPKEALKEGIRGITNWFALRKPRVRGAARQTALLIGASSTNQRDLANALGRETARLLETGLHGVEEVDRSRFYERVDAARQGRPTRPLRLLWSGELQTRKALPVLLRALAKVDPDLSYQVDVLGDGPMRDRWEMESNRLGLSERVHFLGRMPFSAAVEHMHSADVLCFTSLRDTSGNVVLEALAAGVPVICFDHQGARDMINERCGIKLPVSHPSKAIADWAKSIETLARDPQHLLELSIGATEQARTFLWDENHKIINAAYVRLIRDAQSPDLFGNSTASLFDIGSGAVQGTSQ